MMRRISIQIFLGSLFILVTSLQSSAQSWMRESSLEFGLFLGGSNYQGDLVPVAFEPKATHPNVGILTRWNPVQRLSFSLYANYGHLSGYDKWYTNDEDRLQRNLHFKTVLWDFSGRVELNLVLLHYKAERGIIPYLFSGVSVFKFNPQAQFTYDPNSWKANGLIRGYDQLADRDGEWVDLQPLGTEGQGTTEYNDRKVYALTQVAIPFGAGFKFRLNRYWTVGLEWGIRKTFTDYLDDVSSTYAEPVYLESHYGPMSPSIADQSNAQSMADAQRGDPNDDDWYNIFGVTVTYRIHSSRVRCPAF